MKRRMLAVVIMLGIMLWGFNIYAANGDLIVNGKIGVGTSAPKTKLDVNGDVKVGSTTTTCNSTTEGSIHYNSTIKMMEFCNGTDWLPIGLAEVLYASQYPPAQSGTYVTATTNYTGMYPYYTTDPTKSLTGGNSLNSWQSSPGNDTNQRFHIDLGSSKLIKRIYYENAHNSGIKTACGAKDFTFWGSNDPGAFASLTYSIDADPNGTWAWHQLTTSQTSFNQHSSNNVAEPRDILLTNTESYRYYAFKFANNYGDTTCGISVRRIELQTENGWK